MSTTEPRMLPRGRAAASWRALGQLMAFRRSAMARNTSWVLGGNLAGRGLSLVSFMILTRALGPEDYGLFSIAVAVLNMAIELSELGINASAIRYGAEYATQRDWPRLGRLYSVVLRSRLAISAAVFLAGMVAAAPLARYVFNRPELTVYLQLATGGVFGTILLSAFIAILQANQEFRKAVCASSVSGALNLVGVGAFWLAGALTPLTGLVAYLVSPLVATLVALSMMRRYPLSLRYWDPAIARRLFGFGRWMAVWAIATIVQSRLDIVMLANLTTTTEVGYFNAAFRIAVLAQLLPNAYGTVLLPRMSGVAGRAALRNELRRSGRVVLALAGLIGAASLLAPLLIGLLTGDQYRAAIPVLQVLLWGMVFFTLNLPFSSTLYALERAFVFAALAVVGLPATFLVNLVTIPRLGAAGAAVTYLVMQFTVLVVSGIACMSLLRRRATAPASSVALRDDTGGPA